MKERTRAILAFVGLIAVISLMAYFPWSKVFPKPLAVQRVTSNDVSESKLLDDDAIMGETNAPILIVEFGDFMCPFCGKIHREIEPLWRKEFIETGKARYVFRDFVGLDHPQAFVAAQANECADAQDKQWQMYDLLYDNAYNGDKWGAILDDKSVIEVMEKYARQIGLDMPKFESCMTEGDFVGEVQEDRMAAFQLGLMGTPIIYIGNDKTGFSQIRGAGPYSVYKQVIEEKLKE